MPYVGNVGRFIRNIQRSIPKTPSRRRRRGRDEDPAQNRYRHLRLKARGRVYKRDASNVPKLSMLSALAVAAVAAGVGIRLGILLDLGPGGTMLMPFVLVGLGIVAYTKLPLGARLLGLTLGLGFILWGALF